MLEKAQIHQGWRRNPLENNNGRVQIYPPAPRYHRGYF